MSNPQLENGYIRIANEIWDEVIRRDFSKRQKDILLFIWRLSYGCQRREAIIPKMKDFELCGVPATQIKNELTYLERCRVLAWDREQRTFEINKNYETWYVNPVRTWDEDRFSELLHTNLNSKKNSQNMKKNFMKHEDLEEKNFTKHEVFDGEEQENFTFHEGETSQNMKSNFTKHEVSGGLNPCGSKAEDVSKDSIKDIIKNSSSTKLDNTNQDTTDGSPRPLDDFSYPRIYRAYEKNFSVDGRVTEFDIEELGILFDEYGGEWLLESMREAFRHGKRTLAYVRGVLNGYKERGSPNKESPSKSSSSKGSTSPGASVPDVEQTKAKIDEFELAKKRKEEFLRKQRELKNGDERIPNTS